MLTRQAYGLVPRIKITDLLTEVDGWCDFGRHFTHLRSGDAVSDRALLLTAILADGINLGLTRMADACPGVSLSTLSRIATWHIRDETYAKALAEVVDHHHQLEFAAHWGDGTASSSDGQRFQSGGSGEAVGSVNARYGNEPGATFYTHISDQYAPFHIKLISATVRDATHVLDGLLYHESDLHIEEHYTDTAGFTDHVFALCHLLGFRFAPRIRNLADTRLYAMEKPSGYSTLAPLMGGVANRKRISGHWDEILRLATSIKHGSVTASLMLRKLGAYPRQNGLAVALRELGKIERTLFLLQYISSVELRRRIHVGLNKGEARNALARAVFFNRLGELRDRTHKNQRASRKWAEPRGCRHRALEHSLLGARCRRDSPERADNIRRDAHPPLTAQVGGHQPDWRLPLAQGRRAWKPHVTSPQNQPFPGQRLSLTCNF